MLTLEKLERARSLGPVVVDIEGTTLSAHEIRRLQHPLTGAVILFTRNYSTPEELTALTGAIHAVRPGILITVDHEGGRVQRFREGFTEIPPMGDFLRLGSRAPGLLAQAGFILASELRAVGVDFSFTPVLDIDYGRSKAASFRGSARAAWVPAGSTFRDTAGRKPTATSRSPRMSARGKKCFRTLMSIGGSPQNSPLS